MTYCGEHTLLGQGPGVKRLVTLKCRSWGCEGCSECRQRQLIAQVCQGEPNRFLTLTKVRTQGETAATAAKALAHGWRKIRRILIDRIGIKSLEFLAVFEAHQSGWPHLHIAVRSTYIDQRLLSRLADEIMGSPIVHIRQIDSTARAARYIGKYISKSNVRFGTCKRYWASKGYRIQKRKEKAWHKRKELVWSKQHQSLISMAEDLEMLGWELTWHDDGSVTAEKEDEG